MGYSGRPDSLGNTLGGLAGLIAGLSKFRDPNRDKRQELLDQIKANPALAQKLAQQLQDNPNSLDSLGKPRFGSNKANVLDYLKGITIDPATQFADNEAKAALGLQRRDAMAPANDLLKSLGAPGVTPLSGNESERYDAVRSKSLGIDSEIDRSYKKVETEYHKALANASKAGLDESTIDKNRIKAAIPIAQQTLARVGPSNLWKAVRDGKVSPQEQDALYTLPSYKAMIDDQKENDFRTKENEARLSGNANQRKEALAGQIVMTGMRAGVLSGTESELAMKLIDSPQLAQKYIGMKEEDVSESEKPMWKVANAYKIFNEREGIERRRKAFADFRDVAKVTLGYATQGRIEPTEEMVSQLNQQAQLAFGATGIEAPQWRLNPGVKDMALDKPYIELIGGDSEVVKQLPAQLKKAPVEAPAAVESPEDQKYSSAAKEADENGMSYTDILAMLQSKGLSGTQALQEADKIQAKRKK